MEFYASTDPEFRSLWSLRVKTNSDIVLKTERSFLSSEATMDK